MSIRKSAEESANIMKLTSQDLYEMGIVDEIIKEPLGGVKVPTEEFINDLKEKILNVINDLKQESKEKLLENRYKKFRKIGEC